MYARHDRRGGFGERIDVLWDAQTAERVYQTVGTMTCPKGTMADVWRRTGAFDVVEGWGILHAFVTLPRVRAENDNRSTRQVRAATIGLLAASVALALAHNEEHHPHHRVDVQYAIDLLDDLHGGACRYTSEQIEEVGRRVRHAVDAVRPPLDFIDPPTGHEN